MNNLKSYLLLFIGFLFSIVNLYSQTNRIDNYYLDHFEKLKSNKHKNMNHDQRYNEIEYSRILHHMQNQEFESSFVVDSITSKGYYADNRKYVYSYDTKGNLTSELGKWWDENQLLWYSRRFTWAYDSNNNMTSELGEEWDENENQFVLRYRNTWAYDSNNNMTSELSEEWRDKSLYHSGRSTYTYDNNNNMTSELSEDWDGNQWVYSSISTYTYDSNNNMTSKLDEDWDGNQWVYSSRLTWAYDSNNHMTSELWEGWVENENQWVYSWRYTCTYDSNNNMTFELWERWDENQWVYSGRSNYTYDSNNNMTFRLGEDWDENQWVNSSRDTYIYDSNSNLTFAKFEMWENGNWTPLGDFGYASIYLIFNDSFGNEFWVQGSEISIYYSVITEVENSNHIINNFSLSQNYPNPFNPSSAINYSIPKQSNVTLKVFDVLGGEVVTLVNKEQPQGNYEVEFDGSDLTSGIYFYRIIAGEFVQTKKMILLK